ncbi:MAG: serine/threonine protein kinase [Planctomycetaceae bacterium]|nr:serine/threonine protein kinase [Planctomycetaceae bacterium]
MSDDILAAVLSELMDQLHAGVTPDVNEQVRRHPELEQDIRSMWATVVVAENFAPGSDSLDRSEAMDADIADSTCLMEGSRPQPVLPRQLGNYELQDELGRGGMGIVYLARQKTPQRSVAVKMLLRGAFETPQNLARFQAEAQAAAKLDHPHIVKVFEVGEFDSQPFFSMQHINGTTLAHRIAQGPLSNRAAAELMVPVCRAIAHAHRQGLLHRDLKPSNILLDTQGHPYVSDFGLAKQVRTGESAVAGVGSLTQSGAILGTPGYMAPEQAIGERGRVTPATDVYSLGAVLYACLTGRAPFQAATPVDAILMILEQEPPPPRLLNPQIDGDLEMIILKALQKPADLRYQTADALADDLTAYLQHEPISARSSQFTQILSRAFRPTHHIGVLENWGLLWMLHAAVLLVLCIVTDVIHAQGGVSRWPYMLLWIVGLGTWAIVFWNLRHRAGPVTFVERQIAHIWAASMACSSALYGVEALLKLPPLTLSPVLALIAGSVFVAKAGILSGEFYIHAIVLFLTAIPMALFPQFALTIFGVVSALSFFLPGLKFHQIKKLAARRQHSST